MQIDVVDATIQGFYASNIGVFNKKRNIKIITFLSIVFYLHFNPHDTDDSKLYLFRMSKHIVATKLLQLAYLPP